jgi:glycosyltransferase involved in cell wall biosynthesis
MVPLLSIVVPTKNRHYYLEFLVRYFHSIDSDKIELIIQDNSDPKSNSEFISFINEINDLRISYSYIIEELSVVENCDRAIANARGEYVTLIGDDDIFSKHLIEFVEICKNKSIDAILPIKGSYKWPDVQPRLYKNKLSGVFRLTHFSGRSKKIEVNSILERVLELGGTKILNLPRVYHGVIKKYILEQIFEESGSYFPGPSPDMANAIALCKFIKNYITIDIPLVISGNSISSAGGQGSQGQHFGEISKIKHLPKDTASNWSSKVPFYWSGKTIYAESVIQALKRMKMSNHLEKINFEYLYASCIVFDTNYRDRVRNVMKQFNLNFINFKLQKIYYYFILIWINRILFHLRNNLILLLPDVLKQKNKIFKKQNILEVAILNDELIEKKFHKFS